MMPLSASSFANDLCFAGDFLRRQAQTLRLMAASLGVSFTQGIEILGSTKGKVGVFGAGGKRYLAHRLANRFSATGTPSFYLAPEDISFGNSFPLSKDDIVVCLFNDGDMDRYSDDVFNIARKSIQILTITNRASEWINKISTVLIELPGRFESEHDIESDSCEDQLFLAAGDMLALSLMHKRNASRHAQQISERKSTRGRRVQDVMTSSSPPLLPRGETVRAARMLLRRHAPCVVGVMNKERLVGIVSDSDFRRVRGRIDLDMPVERIMRAPKTIEAEASLAEAVLLLKQSGDPALLVTRDKSPVGFLAALDCLRA